MDKYISRMQLVMSLQAQYQKFGYGTTPFVIEKDGKSNYNLTKDVLAFTCCGNIEHKHYMTPMQMLMLEKKYGPQPCVYCRQDGVQITKDRGINEDPDTDMMIMKNFIESKDSGSMAQKRKEVERLIKEAESKNRFTVNDEYEEGDIVVASKSYENYVKRHPDYQPTEIVGDSENRFNKGFDNPFSKKKKEFQPKVRENDAEIKSDISEEEAEVLASLGLVEGIPKPTQNTNPQQVNPNLKNILSDEISDDEEEEE